MNLEFRRLFEKCDARQRNITFCSFASIYFSFVLFPLFTPVTSFDSLFNKWKRNKFNALFKLRSWETIEFTTMKLKNLRHHCIRCIVISVNGKSFVSNQEPTAKEMKAFKEIIE